MNEEPPMMSNQKGEHKSRTIPVRFLDEEDEQMSRKAARRDASSDEGSKPSAEDLGRESSYDDETEMQRRIDRGQEDDTEAGQDRADDADVAGAPPVDEMP